MTATMLFFWGVFLGTVLGTALGYAIKAARDQHTQIQVSESKTGSIQIQVYVEKPGDRVNEPETDNG